ncbi:MAG: DUF3667 domain-containing protein [Chitinophagales bacterium]|nr:DUF3667 domain-containing protein [Bacteroidota bacterium]MCB9044242.1 DUF3667 domain-containing protein [Chitinophagales bacterium]
MKPKTKSSACENCNFPFAQSLYDNYCPNCGQENSNKHLRFSQLVIDFLGDLFAFDTKVFQSLKLLLLKPGMLSKMYWQGKRIRFVPPVRLFIWLGVVFFFLLNLKINSMLKETSSQSLAEMVMTEIVKKQKDTVNISDEVVNVNVFKKKDTLDSNEIKTYIALAASDISPEAFADSVGLEPNSTKRLLGLQLLKLSRAGQRDLGFYIFAHITWAVFCLVPVLAMWLSLVFLRHKDIYFLQNLIFSLHFHAFIFVVLSVYLLFNNFYATSIVVAIILLGVYFLLAMRKMYGQAWWKTILKSSFLTLSYLLSASLVWLLYFVLSLLFF